MSVEDEEVRYRPLPQQVLDLINDVTQFLCFSASFKMSSFFSPQNFLSMLEGKKKGFQNNELANYLRFRLLFFFIKRTFSPSVGLMKIYGKKLFSDFSQNKAFFSCYFLDSNMQHNIGVDFSLF